MIKNKIKGLVIISRFKEDFSWIEEYTDNYIVHNKGVPIYDNPHVINTPNKCKNALDIPYFAIQNHGNLPRLMIFIQAYPFDHCPKPIFDELVIKDKFTIIDDPFVFGKKPQYGVSDTGVFCEKNGFDFFYGRNKSLQFKDFNSFMEKYFDNYDYPEWVEFGKGLQYIVEKEQLSTYPILFWESIINDLHGLDEIEGHYVERAMYYILTRKYNLKKEYYA